MGRWKAVEVNMRTGHITDISPYEYESEAEALDVARDAYDDLKMQIRANHWTKNYDPEGMLDVRYGASDEDGDTVSVL